MEAAVEMKRRAGRNRQLTERDGELCGFLAVCRYLTREQIERLMFPGRSKARSSTRLRQLASSIGGQAAVIRGDLGIRKRRGMDDGLGFDGGRLRDRIAVAGTETGADAEARRGAVLLEARGNAQ